MKDSMSWRLGRSVRDRIGSPRRSDAAGPTDPARRPAGGWTAATGPPPEMTSPPPPIAMPPEDDAPSPEAPASSAHTTPTPDPETSAAPRPAPSPDPDAGLEAAMERDVMDESAEEPLHERSDAPSPAPLPKSDVHLEASIALSGDGSAGSVGPDPSGGTGPVGAATTEAADPGPDAHIPVTEDRVMNATVLCVANQKGGVGKTTTTVSLAAALAAIGAKVLVVDLDPQGNATTGLGLRAEEGDPSTYGVLVDGLPVADAAQATEVPGLDVLPSSLDLAGAEVELVPAFSREMRLRKALDNVRSAYDVVFVDCPPSLGLLTINALVAADQVLVPIQCEYYALEGLGQLMRTVKLVGDNLNRDLELGGVVLTMYDGRTNLSQQVVDEVRDYFGDRAYGTIIPRTVRLSEAPSFGQPIGVFDPASRGARSYDRLAREMAERLALPLAEEQEPDISPLDRLLGGAPPPKPTASASPNDRDEEGQP
jgi:chromosome partitioning protein